MKDLCRGNAVSTRENGEDRVKMGGFWDGTLYMSVKQYKAANRKSSRQTRQSTEVLKPKDGKREA